MATIPCGEHPGRSAAIRKSPPPSRTWPSFRPGVGKRSPEMHTRVGYTIRGGAAPRWSGVVRARTGPDPAGRAEHDRARSPSHCAQGHGSRPRPGVWDDGRPADHRAPHNTRQRTYYFCSAHCQSGSTRTRTNSSTRRRRRGRGRGRRGRRRVHLPDAPGDPAAGPGSCPICGMALEPVVVTAERVRTPNWRT